jgi:hypothetical protein
MFKWTLSNIMKIMSLWRKVLMVGFPITDTAQVCEEEGRSASEEGCIQGPTTGQPSSNKEHRLPKCVRKPNVRVSGPEWRM